MKDCLGEDLKINDYVAGLRSDEETPSTFIVVGFTPKKVKLKSLGYADEATQTLKFPQELRKLPKDAVVQWLERPPVDMLGQPIAVDDYVFGSDSTYVDPIIFRITKIQPPRVIVEKITGGRWIKDRSRLMADVIKIDPHRVTMYKLTKVDGDG